MGRCGPCRGSFVVCPKRIPTCNTMLLLLPKESIVFDCAALISPAAAVRAAAANAEVLRVRGLLAKERRARTALEEENAKLKAKKAPS